MSVTHQAEWSVLWAKLYVGGLFSGLGDDELLARFRDRGAGAEPAFEELVERHGAMVWEVCLRVLSERCAAEDAFQATFLVLVKRSSTLNARKTVGPWLHEVALRTARKALTSDLRRRAREHRAAIPPEAVHRPENRCDEAVRALHEEIALLPEKYRGPVVLCYLEGLTHEAAAARLGRPLGSVKGWLARARERLRNRLTLRGYAPALVASAVDQTIRNEPAVPRMLASRLQDAICDSESVSAAVRALVAASAALPATAGKALGLASAFVLMVLVAVGGISLSKRPANRRTTNQAESKSFAKADLPAGAALRLGDPRFHAGGAVNQAFWTQKGHAFVTLDWNSRVKLWSYPEGKLLRSLGSADSDFRLALRLDDTGLLATAEYPAALRVWNESTGRQLASKAFGRMDDIRPIAVSRDGAILAAGVRTALEGGKYRNRIELYESPTLKPIRSIEADWTFTNGMAFSADRRHLAVACKGLLEETPANQQERSSVRGFEVDTGKMVWKHSLSGFAFESLAPAADGHRIVVGVGDSTVRIYDFSTGAETLPRIGADQAFRDGAAGLPTTDPEVAAPKALDRRFYDPKTGVGKLGVAACLACSPDGKLIAWGERTSSVPSALNLAPIHVWDVSARKEVRVIPAHMQWVSALEFSNDGKTLASAGAESVVRFWNVESGAEVLSHTGHRGTILAHAVSELDRTVWTAGSDGTVRRWDAKSGQELGVVVQLNRDIQNLALSPDGQTLLIGVDGYTRESGYLEYETSTQKFVKKVTIPGSFFTIGPVQFSADGKRLACNIGIVELASGNPAVDFQREPDRYGTQSRGFALVRFFPDQTRVLAHGDDGIWVRDPASGEAIRRVLDPALARGRSAISPDGRYLALGGYNDAHALIDPPIRLYEIASGKQVLELGGDDLATTRTLAFEPTGRVLASANGPDRRESEIRLWDLDTGREIKRFEGHAASVTGLAFIDHVGLLSTSLSGEAIVWDVSTPPKSAQAPPPGRRRIDALIEFLAGQDAPRAYRAIRELSRADALDALESKLEPRVLHDATRLESLIKGVSSPDRVVRSDSVQRLLNIGAPAAAAIRKAQAERPTDLLREFAASFERRIREPIENPETLRRIRGIEVLERIGSVRARAMLERLAQATTSAPETAEAKLALARLTEK